jgi:hypothetical protein
MEKAKLRGASEWILGGFLGFLISTLGYHYFVGQSWEFLLGGIPGVIAIGLIMLAVRYMRRWFAPRD